MYRFFEDRDFQGNTNLKEETLHHLKNVIRIKDGEVFQVVFEDGIFSFAYEGEKIKILEKSRNLMNLRLDSLYFLGF